MKLPLNKIIIGERQRLDIGDLSDLDSMADPDVGLIQPIIVHRTPSGHELVAGRRRLAKATQLGWPEIEVIERDSLTYVQKQKQELFEDVARLDRPWQDRCLSVAKIHTIMRMEKAEQGDKWTIQHTALATGFGYTQTQKFLTIAELLSREPKDEQCWQCTNFTEAYSRCVVDRLEQEARAELDKRRALLPSLSDTNTTKAPEVVDGSTFQPTLPTIDTSKFTYSLSNRATSYNNQYSHLEPPNTPLVVVKGEDREFIHGFWFMGMGSYNVSDFYGSYQADYLKRIGCLFTDIYGKQNILHIFAGSLPPSLDYTTVGVDPTGQYKADYEFDVHELSSRLPFKPRLIYADPPYSVEDSEHYQNSMVNRARVVEECGLILQPGGFLVWMDQALPVFSNELFTFVGAISYIRGTGNRFRLVSIFQKKPQNALPNSPQPVPNSQ